MEAKPRARQTQIKTKMALVYEKLKIAILQVNVISLLYFKSLKPLKTVNIQEREFFTYEL